VADGVPPVPLRSTFCVPPGALSAIVRLALRAPPAAGVKVTLAAQLAPTASVVPQVFVWEKSPAFVPVTLTLLMASKETPELVIVTTCGVLLLPTGTAAKERLVGESVTAAVPPVPDRGTFCALPEALSVKLRLAVSAAPVLGVKVTLAVQLAPTASDVPQVFVWAKSATLAPVKPTAVIEIATVPVLVMVTICGALVVP
jgi:hypothetical protein